MRKSNFELLRIIAMFMIVGSHYSVYGVRQWFEQNALTIWNAGTENQKIIGQFFSPGGGVGVAIFFMLTGYFGIYSKKLSIKKVVLATVYYGIVLTVVGLGLMVTGVAGKPQLSSGGIIYNAARNVFNPVTSGIYWFVTVYCLVAVASPLINRFYLRCSEKGQFIILIAVYIIEYVWPQFDVSEYFNINRGVFFYLVGACLRINFEKIKISKITAMCLSLVAWFCYVLANVYVDSVYNSDDAILKLTRILISGIQSAVLIPILAILFFVVVSKSDIGYKKYINVIAETTFGIYLIHDSAMIKYFIWDDVLKVAAFQYNSSYFVLFMIASIITVFVVCAGLEKIRLLFVAPKIEGALMKAKNKFENKYITKVD